LHSAGGGGKSETRKAKIKEKNEKLHVQRQNAQIKKKEEGKEGGEGGGGRDVHDGMHPSRRAQIGV
jgi:nucleolar protein 6